MKNKTLKIFVVLILASNVISAQWEVVYPAALPWLNAVKFYDFNNGFAVGHRNYSDGIILRTANNGTNWDTVYSTIDTLGFNDLSLLDSSTIIAIGSRVYCCNAHIGIIAKSNDFGNTWTRTTTSVGLNSICFPTQNVGYIAGNFGTIFKTVTGGNTWNPLISGITCDLNSIFFINDSVGFACGNDTIIKTTNGGINWVNQSFADGNIYNNEIFFPSDSVGYYKTFGSGSNIYKTLDQGNTWNLQSTISDFFVSSSIFFTDNNTGYLTIQWSLLKTTDGGITWNQESNNQGNQWLDDMMDVFFLNKDTGFVVGNDQFYRIPFAISTSINENTLKDNRYGISVFPNPTKEKITINIPLIENKEIEMTGYNIFGQRIFMQKIYYNNTTTTLDISQFPAGIYFIRVTNDEQMVYEKKIIITK